MHCQNFKLENFYIYIIIFTVATLSNLTHSIIIIIIIFWGTLFLRKLYLKNFNIKNKSTLLIES